MEQMQVFNNAEFGEVRTVLINSETWFVGVDVSKALGYNSSSKPVQRHVDKDDVLKQHLVDSAGRTQEFLVVNESGLYSLILSSKIESASRFKKWVTSEVLPCIRKTGSYQKPLSALEQLNLHNKAILEVNDKVEEVRQDLEEFKLDIPLFSCDMDRITTAVKKMGVKCLGGKSASAYQDKSLRTKVYSDIYDQLKRQFGVSSYKSIKRNQCDVAVQIVESYQLPLVLQDEIEGCNGQLMFV